MITCECPAAGSIPTISTVTCPVNFGQIQKVAFTRIKNGNVLNSFETTASGEGSIVKKASWTPKLSATDSTKISVSCYIQAPTEEGGDAITFGGGNDTLGGVEMIVGRNPVTFSGVIRSEDQIVISRLKQLQCEAQAGNLGVYLFDENGNIECLQKGSKAYPIPIRSLFIGDKIHGGLETPDSNAISWSYDPNYSDNLMIFTPTDFNPLTDFNID